MSSVARPEDKSELFQLAASTGLQVDESVLGLLVELVSLGAQPKHVVDYLKLVLSKATPKPVHSAAGH